MEQKIAAHWLSHGSGATALWRQHRPCCLPQRRGPAPPPPHSPPPPPPLQPILPVHIPVDSAWGVCPGRRPAALERQQGASASSSAACTEGPWHPARVGTPAVFLLDSRKPALSPVHCGWVAATRCRGWQHCLPEAAPHPTPLHRVKPSAIARLLDPVLPLDSMLCDFILIFRLIRSKVKPAGFRAAKGNSRSVVVHFHRVAPPACFSDLPPGNAKATSCLNSTMRVPGRAEREAALSAPLPCGWCRQRRRSGNAASGARGSGGGGTGPRGRPRQRRALLHLWTAALARPPCTDGASGTACFLGGRLVPAYIRMRAALRGCIWSRGLSATSSGHVFRCSAAHMPYKRPSGCREH